MVAVNILRRAAELDLAVVAIEAFTLDEVGLDPIGGSAIDLGAMSTPANPGRPSKQAATCRRAPCSRSG
jgi:hypothetical protein